MRGKVVICHGVMVQVTRYDDVAMEAIFGATCIPVVSTKDRVMLKRCFEMAHVVYSLAEEDLVSISHRSVSQTLQAAKHGVGSFSCVGMRNIFKGFSSNCPRCVKHNFEGPKGDYSV